MDGVGTRPTHGVAGRPGAYAGSAPSPRGPQSPARRAQSDEDSRRLQPGDTVALAARSRDLPAFTVPLENTRPAAHLELDRERRSVRIREVPEREQIPVQCEVSQIVEYYSR